MRNKIIKFSVLIFVFSVLSACSKSQFMDISGFIYRYNRISEEKIKFENVYSYIDEGEKIFEIYPDNSDVVIKLISENDRIKQVRIAFSKTNENGTFLSAESETVSEFIKITENAVRTFCEFDDFSARSLMKNLGLYDIETYRKQGELNTEKDSFRFIYYSDSLVCDFMINNTYICASYPTEKPVSKPDYGNTTNIRGETRSLPTFKR